MQEEVFNELAELALKGSGQAIPKSKSYLIEARLAAIARREGRCGSCTAGAVRYRQGREVGHGQADDADRR